MTPTFSYKSGPPETTAVLSNRAHLLCIHIESRSSERIVEDIEFSWRLDMHGHDTEVWHMSADITTMVRTCKHRLVAICRINNLHRNSDHHYSLQNPPQTDTNFWGPYYISERAWIYGASNEIMISLHWFWGSSGAA